MAVSAAGSARREDRPVTCAASCRNPSSDRSTAGSAPPTMSESPALRCNDTSPATVLCTSNFEKPIATLRNPSGPRSRQTSTSCPNRVLDGAPDVEDLIADHAAQLPHFDRVSRLRGEVFDHRECGDCINRLAARSCEDAALRNHARVHHALGPGDELCIGLKEDRRRDQRPGKERADQEEECRRSSEPRKIFPGCEQVRAPFSSESVNT